MSPNEISSKRRQQLGQTAQLLNLREPKIFIGTDLETHSKTTFKSLNSSKFLKHWVLAYHQYLIISASIEVVDADDHEGHYFDNFPLLRVRLFEFC